MKVSLAIEKKEWRFVFWLSIFLIFVTGIPYLLGWLSAPSDRTYNGLHALTPADFPVYYAYILQVKNGALTVMDLFTTESQIGILNVWWLLVGWLARGLQLSPPVAFHLARLLMIPVFVSILYLVIAKAFTVVRQRRLAMLFVIFAGGVGGYTVPFLSDLPVDNLDSYQWPIDLWISESSTFNILYHTSHFIASISATLGIFLLAFNAFTRRSIGWAAAAGVVGLFYFNFHPFYVPTVFGTLGMYIVVDSVRRRQFLWREFLLLGVIVLIALPSVGYHFLLLNSSKIIRLRAMQNVTDISPLPFVIAGYGFLLPGLVLGLYALFRQRAWNGWWRILACWGVVNIALIYSPAQFHSRYTQGLSIVFSLFSVYGLIWLYEVLRRTWSAKKFNFWVNNPALLGMLFVLMFAPSTIMSVIRDVYQFIYKPGRVLGYYYLPNGVMDAYAWLGEQSKGKIVLAFDPNNKFVPAFSAQKTYAAHGIETIFYQSKIAEVRRFYGSDGEDDAKKNFLRARGIDFVLYSEYEKALGSFNPSSKPYLELVFNAPDAQLYRVTVE